MKHVLLMGLAALLFSCAPDRSKKNAEESPDQAQSTTKSAVEEVIANPTKGIGAVKSVTLKSPLEKERVDRGSAIYEMKCQACHKLTTERLVGPGWKDVTQRRHPEWIMNMITNVDVMLEKDNEAQKMLELCLVRMPNQNISIGDARDVLEFMRNNDGQK
ncbi:MAG: c-type cytochrome [Bacteroidetes bacterium]|nr:c-type cytochrome [Bacteroidota bacterium]